MANKHVQNHRHLDHRLITIAMLDHRRKNRLKANLPKTKAKSHRRMIHAVMRRNLPAVRRNHIVRNMIHRNHHQNERIQHEVDQDHDRDHVVIDRVTGSYVF